MIRHVLKLAWNRKRSNALVILEIFASFLVTVAVVTLVLQLASNYRRPLGFDYRDVWTIRIERGTGDDFTGSASDMEMFQRLLTEARSIDGVVAATGAFSVPYDNSTSTGVWGKDGRTVTLELNQVGDEFRDVFGLTVTRGRWFAPEDEALAYRPLVIDEEMARDWFGAEDPIGKPLDVSGGEGPEERVVGVVTDFRKNGELSAPVGYLFQRVRVADPAGRPPRNIALKVRPGLDARFEQELVTRLQAVVKDWSLEVRRLDQLRESSFRVRLTPVIGGGIVALFLLLMVALGLLGVLWQNVARRTREIGLRRATGATRSGICRQMLLEACLTATLALLVGAALVVQLPLLDLIPVLDARILGLGTLVSAAAIYLLALTCATYPSMLAARIRPAEALHQE